MSKIDIKLLGSELVFTFVNEFHKSYDRITIDVRSDGESLDIIYTTEGNIKGHRVYINRRLVNLSYAIAYNNKISDLESIVAFYSGNDIVNQEIITSHINKIHEEDRPVVNTVKTDIIDLQKLDDIDESIQKYESKWKFDLVVASDIIATRQAGDTGIYLVFGDMDTQIRSSDLIFPVNSNMKQIIIPKEIVWKNHSLYRGEFLCLGELVQIDCLEGVYYKAPISNRIKISECPQIVQSGLLNFATPTRGHFGKEWVVDPHSNLPVLGSKL